MAILKYIQSAIAATTLIVLILPAVARACSTMRLNVSGRPYRPVIVGRTMVRSSIQSLGGLIND